jgi:hypothetical protein
VASRESVADGGLLGRWKRRTTELSTFGARSG